MALGNRLWPEIEDPAIVAQSGLVGALCYYCHGSGGGAFIPAALADTVMTAGPADLTHGRDALQIPTGDGVDGSLPYGGDGVFQCTTCHDVHDDTDAPFLQDDIDVLCARCHNNRQFVSGAASATQGPWGANFGLANPGSHPMGTDVFDDQDGDSPVDLTADGRFNLAWGASEGHNLGGHLIDGATVPGAGAGMTCATCHSVHGVQDDNVNPGTGTYNQDPVANLLTIPQPTVGGAFDDAYNGNGDPNNALCEACHTGFAGATLDASTGLAYGGAGYNVNPGNQAYTHPVDDLGASGSASVSAFPADWPVGSTPGTNVSPGPICESCHTPHPLANVGRPTIVGTGTGTHILRAPEDAADVQYLCTQCHDFTAEGAGHHPYNVDMGTMSDPLIGDGDAILTCDDCHGQGAGAHNWAGGGVGLDPDWMPAGNAKGPRASEMDAANTSMQCAICHQGGRADGCPTNNRTNTGGTVSHAWRTSDSYQDIGEGTHYTGPTSMDYSLGSFAGGGFDATTDDWTGQGQPNPRWSRFMGTLGTVVCESCHELEADKNVPGTALLLAYHNDGGTGPNDDPSGLCEGCHGTSPGGSGTPHPMTGDTVSRTGAALTTTGLYTRGVIEGNATYPAGDALNCDSCHQPHDADTQGGTYIYESGQDTPIVHDVTSSNLVDGQARGATIPDIEDAPFCDSCHFYLE
jgi:predicted CXXCH cytochrome family protein